MANVENKNTSLSRWQLYQEHKRKVKARKQARKIYEEKKLEALGKKKGFKNRVKFHKKNFFKNNKKIVLTPLLVGVGVVSFVRTVTFIANQDPIAQKWNNESVANPGEDNIEEDIQQIPENAVVYPEINEEILQDDYTPDEMPASTISNYSQEEKDSVAYEYMDSWGGLMDGSVEKAAQEAASTENFNEKLNSLPNETKEGLKISFFSVTDFLFYGKPLTCGDGRGTFYLSDLSEGAKAEAKKIYFSIQGKLVSVFPSIEGDYEGYLAGMGAGYDLYVSGKNEIQNMAVELLGQENIDTANYWTQRLVEQCQADVSNSVDYTKAAADTIKNAIATLYEKQRDAYYGK